MKLDLEIQIMPINSERSMHQRPGEGLKHHLADRERLRDYLLWLVFEILKETTTLKASVEISPSPYFKSSRALPNITLSIVAEDPDSLRECITKITSLSIQKGLTLLRRMSPGANGNGNGDGVEKNNAIFELSLYNNRHRTVS